MTAATAKGGKAHAISHAIDSFDNSLAATYTHMHPLVVLGVFYYQFDSLVENAIDTLPKTAIAVAILQVVYLCLCIPGSNHASLHPKTKHGQKKKAGGSFGEPGIGFKLVPGILSLVLAITLGAPVIALGLILLGAPFTTHQFHTMLCGVHMSLLTALPLFYVHGVDGPKWTEVAALNAPLDEVHGAALGALVGAWIGAIPIPLDWDREWQKWPITIITGAYIGYAVGKMVGGYLLKGTRIKLS